MITIVTTLSTTQAKYNNDTPCNSRKWEMIVIWLQYVAVLSQISKGLVPKEWDELWITSPKYFLFEQTAQQPAQRQCTANFVLIIWVADNIVHPESSDFLPWITMLAELLKHSQWTAEDFWRNQSLWKDMRKTVSIECIGALRLWKRKFVVICCDLLCHALSPLLVSLPKFILCRHSFDGVMHPLLSQFLCRNLKTPIVQIPTSLSKDHKM